MKRIEFLVIFLLLSCFAVSIQCYGGKGLNPLSKFIKTKILSKKSSTFDYTSTHVTAAATPTEYSPVSMSPQDGLKDADRIEILPGQPDGVDFEHYSGYVTVDEQHGRALFYYFAESPQNSSTKPLVLWLNGGPGCSSFGNGAMMELGPFRVNSDGETLYRNEFAWNNDANILFLESPAGVGFSYSNTTSDYKLSGDKRTAEDSYKFLITWLERFPEYKTRDFFITGESYAGHYIPQLAQLIVQNNMISNQTVINLRGIMIGNAWIDFETGMKGGYDYLWTHALLSDEINEGITLNCNFSTPMTVSEKCIGYLEQVDDAVGNIFPYDIYAPLCNPNSSNSSPVAAFDPCSDIYIQSYLNIPEVQKALHANVTAIPYPWESCSDMVGEYWNDSPLTVLPVIQELMASTSNVWLYSGDTDSVVPVTSTRYAIDKLNPPIEEKWGPWYFNTYNEVGGYVVEYKNLQFVTVRGAGHFVPSYQPARALLLLSAFIDIY